MFIRIFICTEFDTFMTREKSIENIPNYIKQFHNNYNFSRGFMRD